ncbi:transcription antitermination factor NusB [Candidatus Margulisiibacteriota bacterium]
MGKRFTARRLAFQILYQADLNTLPVNDVYNDYLSIQDFKPKDKKLLDTLVYGAHEHLTAIDTIITEHCRDWSFERLNPVDRNILRLALYELIFSDDSSVPKEVIITEAVELANKYGTKESSGFVNGVLGAVSKEREHEKTTLTPSPSPSPSICPSGYSGNGRGG